MTTTKEGGGRGEREREKERERERVKSRETLFCWSRQNWWEKRERRGGDGVNDVVNALLLPWKRWWGSERRETGLGCSKSRKSPRKMNLLISLVVVGARWKEFLSREEQKKTKKREKEIFDSNKQKRRTEQKETTETRNWPNTFLSFITQHTHYY